ncbi:MAG TPA: tetratricopeptide repeat protein, partial [Aggregatilineales bacterium]|nr:tetratricopeptide repeat protein [Aggregatilineales bacterium]
MAVLEAVRLVCQPQHNTQAEKSVHPLYSSPMRYNRDIVDETGMKAMSQIEKTVFISYRRTNIFHARAIFENLRYNGYDVFLDYESIDSGAFDTIILNQIQARAHFVVILTPSALERCNEPNDWLRREIETAIDTKRNIVPLLFDGFNWGNMGRYLVGKMTVLNTYNALDVPANYFDEAMNRLRTRYLNIPIEAVLHPTPHADEAVVERKIVQVASQPPVTESQLQADEYFEKGNQHYFSGNFEQAIRDYTQALLLNPNHPTAYYRRGDSYRETGKPDLATADYDHAIREADTRLRQNPKDSEAYRARGSAYDSKKEYDRAIADFDHAITLNPDNADTYNSRGMTYDNKGDHDRAIADFDHAIMLNPHDADIYNNRGFAYANKKDYDRAIADYNEALRLNPQDALAYNNRGLAYRHKGDYDRAIADYNHAIMLNPNLAKLYNNRGLVYLKKETFDRAIADFESALRLN